MVTANLKENLYFLNFNPVVPKANLSVNKVTPSVELWFQKRARTHHEKVDKTVNLKGNIPQLFQCNPSIISKKQRHSFPKEPKHRRREVGNLTHACLAGPMTTSTPSGRQKTVSRDVTIIDPQSKVVINTKQPPSYCPCRLQVKSHPEEAVQEASSDSMSHEELTPETTNFPSSSLDKESEEVYHFLPEVDKDPSLPSTLSRTLRPRIPGMYNKRFLQHRVSKGVLQSALSAVFKVKTRRVGSVGRYKTQYTQKKECCCAVNKLAPFMSCYGRSHWTAGNRILRYLQAYSINQDWKFLVIRTLLKKSVTDTQELQKMRTLLNLQAIN